MSGQGSAKVEQKDVDADEAGMRVDRWFKLHYPDLAFGALQKLLRTGQVRIDGKRAKSDTRLEAGQSVRIPPGAGGTRSSGAPLTARTMRNASDGEALRKMILYEDRKVLRFEQAGRSCLFKAVPA